MSEPVATSAPLEVKPEEVNPAETFVDAPTDATEPVAAAEPEAPVATETAEEKPVEAAVEPITSGVLGYKAPGLIKSLKFSKRFFWLGDEPVATSSLSHYLRGTEAKLAHPVAAWSSQTGKGLLYLVKAESEKAAPQDILPLAEATDLHKASSHEFAFKIHGEKHTFKAANDAERNGWYTAIEKAIEEAKASKEEIHNSEGYKESFKGLGKPAVVATGAAAAGTAAVAAEEKKEEPTTAAAVAEPAETTEPATETAARVNSVSSDEAKKEKKKSRSASRGKRASIFGSVFGKKEDKVEDKTAETPATETVAAEPAAEAVVPATDAVVEEPKPETAVEPAVEAAPVVAETTEAKEAPVAPKPMKRNSLFGSIYQKVRSPTHEKKESEIVPIVPPKDEAPVEAAAPTTEATATTTEAPVIDVAQPENTITATETKAEEAAAPVAAEEKKVDTPKKEKESFLGTLLSKARAKSPSAKREAKETPVVEAPAVPAKEETPVEEAKPEEAAAPAESAVEETPAAVETPEAKATPKESRRKSLFAGEKKKLSEIFRRSSHVKSEKEPVADNKENIAPVSEDAAATVPVAEPTEAVAAEEKVEAAPVPTETIGDVPAEAISVGKPQESTPTVSATA